MRDPLKSWLITWSHPQFQARREVLASNYSRWKGNMVVVDQGVDAMEPERPDERLHILHHQATRHVHGFPILSRSGALNAGILHALQQGAEQITLTDPNVSYSDALWLKSLSLEEGHCIGSPAAGQSGTLIATADTLRTLGGVFPGYCMWGCDDYDLRAQLVGIRGHQRWNLEDLGGKVTRTSPAMPASNVRLYAERIEALIGLKIPEIYGQHAALCTWLGLDRI